MQWRPRAWPTRCAGRIRRTLDGITGVTLIGPGVKLAAEER